MGSELHGEWARVIGMAAGFRRTEQPIIGKYRAAIKDYPVGVNNVAA